MTKSTVTKAVDGEEAGPGIFTQAGQVTLHIGHTGAIESGEERICGRVVCFELC